MRLVSEKEQLSYNIRLLEILHNCDILCMYLATRINYIRSDIRHTKSY